MIKRIETIEDAKRYFESMTSEGHGITIPGVKIKAYFDGKGWKKFVFPYGEETDTTEEEIINLIYENREIINKKYFEEE